MRDLEIGASKFATLLKGVKREDLDHLMEYFSCYWMTGKCIEWYGTEYAIAYKAVVPEPPVEPALMQAGGDAIIPQTNPLADLTLKISLINVAQIISLTPLPSLSKDDFAIAMVRVNAPNVAHGGNKEVAISNMKQLALGAIMYSSDSDDIYPMALSIGQAKKEIMPYLKDEKVFASQNPNGGQVLYNVNLAGISAQGMPKPAGVPLFYDSRAWPDGGRPVAFCDGHVKYVSAQEWEIVAAELNRKFKRAPAAPPANGGAKPKPKK